MSTENIIPKPEPVIIEGSFLNRILIPYRDHCRYLKEAFFLYEPERGAEGLTLTGNCAIDESCYIDDTGHFNAVEFNICYNQMAYTFLGHTIRYGLIPELAAYDLPLFFEKQLSHVLISRLSSRYASQLNPRSFKGTFGISSATVKSKCIFINTWCSFSDEHSGKSDGEITLAVLHP
ncbi:MAG TPA: FcoT family thioesterase [Chitinophaga sp.]|uniref:FcoT family thioesterase n=1 Tax=Chitinophaga sp. TaxID=1869181 RepID=UPI002B85640B|nr:FcoT family thioesterase [Chitinophaga sp.]HVI45039.1 FcoT family thioesterase [Chitinophaga sp.]